MVFCVAFVMGYGKIFGDENSIVGVIILLCVMVFRNADFGMKMTGSLTSMAIIFSILAFGPRLANMAGLFGELLINAACIFVLLFLRLPQHYDVQSFHDRSRLPSSVRL